MSVSYGTFPIWRGSKGSSTGCEGLGGTPGTPWDSSPVDNQRVLHLACRCLIDGGHSALQEVAAEVRDHGLADLRPRLELCADGGDLSWGVGACHYWQT